MLTLGSLFDGIGGWQLAAVHAGVEPVWSSEIEKFPCAVTAKHFPDTVQLGDITKLDGSRLWPVDIICAGSPCQDLSVAGKQEGLKGARSGLFRTAIRLVHAMRRASGGKYPRFFVWENVPGAFSSNGGMDFRAVLEEIGETEIPMPGSGRWANAGLVELPECQIAWRVLDAQYWGVPQRRKRIFLVADFAERKRRAGEILFVRKSLFGDSAAGGEAREGTAAGTESRAGNASVLRMRSGCAGGGKGALVSREKSLTLAANTNDQVLFVAAGFKAGQSRAGGLGYEIEKAATLAATHSGVEPTVAVYDMTHADEVMRRVKDGVSPTLNARMGTGGNQVPVIAYREGSFANFDETQTGAPLKESGGGMGGGSETLICHRTVRRLTPLECERLQGLPDLYTLIDDKSCSDTARYKALGNGMAMPCADWIIRRIVEEADA